MKKLRIKIRQEDIDKAMKKIRRDETNEISHLLKHNVIQSKKVYNRKKNKKNGE